MSQDPSPYSAPNYEAANYYQPGMTDPLSPARRAGWFLIILGTLAMLLGLCNGIGSFMRSAADLQAEQDRIMGSGQPSPLNAKEMKVLTLVVAGVVLAVGIIGIMIGVVVRGGGSTSIIVGLVYTIGVGLVLGLFVLMFAIAGFAINPMLFLGVCMMGVPFALCIATAWSLFSARKAGRDLAMAQQMYSMQMQQHQMYQQWYNQQQQQPGAVFPQPNPPQTGTSFPGQGDPPAPTA